MVRFLNEPPTITGCVARSNIIVTGGSSPAQTGKRVCVKVQRYRVW
jgi:hypothetical protein